MKKNSNISVSMCVYEKDNPAWFEKALSSIVEQTFSPNEIVLVIDGPIPDSIGCVVKKYESICSEKDIQFKVIKFDINQGHGNARRTSVSNCSNEIIAIMDSDDVANLDRFEKQIALMNSGIDICGGNISEFIDDETNIVSFRNVPTTDKDIRKYAKSRCPMNQMTVMFKKGLYDKAGGYIDWYQDEDYYLWLRMMDSGAIFGNTGTTLVNVRIGNDMFKRRGGWKYYKSERKLQRYMLKKRFISFPRYFVNCSKRFIVQVLMSNRIRGWVFKKVARSKNA